MFVEFRQPPDRLDDVRVLVHDDHRRCAKAGFERRQRVEIHQHVFALVDGEARDRRPAGNDGLEIVPAAAHAAAMTVDQLAEWDRHRFLNHARTLDVAGDCKDFRACIALSAKAGEPACAAPQDRGDNSNRLDIVHGCRCAVETRISRERRFQARHTLFALKAFEQRGFFTANIGARAMGEVDVEIKAAAAGVLADQPIFIRLVDGLLQRLFLAHVLAAYVDIAGMCAHREAGNQTALNQRMRVMAHDFAVFAGSRLGLVGIDDKVMRATVCLLGHERPFQPGRKTRAAATAQAAVLHFLNDPVPALAQNVRRTVPMTARFDALERTILHPVEVGEDTVFIGEKIEAHGDIPLNRARGGRITTPRGRAKLG